MAVDGFTFAEFAEAAGLPDPPLGNDLGRGRAETRSAEIAEQRRLEREAGRDLLKEWFASLADSRGEVQREKFRQTVKSGIAEPRNAFNDQNIWSDISGAFTVLRYANRFT